MFHVLRTPEGSIASLARAERPGGEFLADDHPDVVQFLGRASRGPGFNEADAEFVRVLEDLIDTLMAKNVIRHTDLPEAAQRKLVLRKGLRNRMQDALNLFGRDERIL
jgi:hypothetical protein